MNKVELAKLIKSFLDGSCGEWDWDDFISVKQRDPEIERLRSQLNAMSENYPSSKPTEYCNEEGRKAMLAIAETLLSKD